MLTSTIACATAAPVLLRARDLPVHNRYPGLSHAQSAPGGALLSRRACTARPWLERLRRALAEDLFVLHYQPIVSLKDGQRISLRGARAACRRTCRTPVAPGAFLPAAERYGLIRDIDRMVLGKVAALLGEQASPCAGGRQGVGIAMNLSALSVTDGDDARAHRARARQHGRRPLAARWSRSPETAAISDMERARAFCAGVQALGAAIALDDFERRLRLLPVPQAPDVPLPEDRWRLRPGLPGLPATTSWWSRRSRTWCGGWAGRRSPSSSAIGADAEPVAKLRRRLRPGLRGWPAAPADAAAAGG